MRKNVRKTFWDESKTLISKCTENELLILIDQIGKELNKRIEQWSVPGDQLAKKATLSSKQ